MTKRIAVPTALFLTIVAAIVHARVPCSKWNGTKFFRVATPDDVQDSLDQAGKA